ncbi:MAG: ribonuclease HII [Patescibacteria group bacterium]|jgi:ribonuclease HII
MKNSKTNFEYESIYQNKGYKFIIGVDEVGRGAWAGPVYTAAVALKNPIDDVTDSKLLSPKKREELSEIIKKVAISWAITFATVKEINNLGIHLATFIAFKRAIAEISKADLVLVDGFEIPELRINQVKIIGGDRISNSIAAASIIAKVERDKVMSDLAKNYPEFSFEKHKGYGTKIHQESLIKHGPCEIHRMNYKPIKNILLAKRS